MKQRTRIAASRLGGALTLTVATVLGAVTLAPAALANPAPAGQSPAAVTTAQIDHSAVPTPPAAAPASVTIRNGDGRLERFWRGTDCALWHQWQDSSGTWSGGPASLGGCLLYDIDVSRNADGRLEAFGIGTNREMFHIWQVVANGGWSGWASLGGALVSRPWSFNFSATDRRIYVDALGPDGIWHRKQQNSPNCCWSGWIFGVAH